MVGQFRLFFTKTMDVVSIDAFAASSSVFQNILWSFRFLVFIWWLDRDLYQDNCSFIKCAYLPRPASNDTCLTGDNAPGVYTARRRHCLHHPYWGFWSVALAELLAAKYEHWPLARSRTTTVYYPPSRSIHTCFVQAGIKLNVRRAVQRKATPSGMSSAMYARLLRPSL
jgi:hypothetical protein